ncbi:glucose 1-dehydrogenase [Saccharopolyspora sp. TS4A08]|uniref:Glucose 1-dehydrogenase n=1 Tax=Saccharopolyspora ipomoeae TaxID=3042027 RepID=A0ABT6PRI0_9PSEU|nr:glucose 1-dehydrogenase [Saccharopolyspora sp. TS4A08]MDI2030564.1 glucose 1-dehydrogenase [Saccharopolyspora sp. TS4A08]
MAKLNGKVAIITGGAGGIGKETAQLFLKEGAKVALVDLSAEQLDQARAELGVLGDVITVQANVSKEDDVERYVREVVDRFGRIDAFFNNAGVEGGHSRIVDYKLEEFEKVMSVNARGVFLGLKHVLRVMIQQRNGSVINTSSTAGLMGVPGMVPYSASKHAVVGITRTAALEVAENKVRVNSIHPAPVNTKMMESIEKNTDPDNPEAVKESWTNGIPLKRYADPHEIAALVLFLASDESRFITGAQYRIDGGMGAQS